jgi:tRNA(His) 5'-end guanylyltransferase
MPVIIRVDGKAFHTLTRNYHKPFDSKFMLAMIFASQETAKVMQGFKVAYVQSDEATFVITDYDQLNTQGWFDYNINKIVSISAATMTINFNNAMRHSLGVFDKCAVFDARAFNVPKEEVVNNLLWRQKDWVRNSLQMYARAFFSHKQLNNKNSSDIHEMLHSIGKNWAIDLSNEEKNGTFIVNDLLLGLTTTHTIEPDYKQISKVVDTLIHPF